MLLDRVVAQSAAPAIVRPAGDVRVVAPDVLALQPVDPRAAFTLQVVQELADDVGHALDRARRVALHVQPFAEAFDQEHIARAGDG